MEKMKMKEINVEKKKINDKLINFSSVELNEIFQNNMLITNNKSKKKILEKSKKENTLLTFGVLTKIELQNKISSEVLNFAKFFIYKKTNNFEYASKIINILLKTVNQIEYIKEHKIVNYPEDIEEIMKWYNQLFEKELIKKNFTMELLSEIVYSDNINLKYLNIDYTIVISNNLENDNLESNQKNNLNVFLTNKKIPIYEFSQIENETNEALNYVTNLIKEGIHIGNIKIYAPENYYDLLKTMSHNYKVNLNINKQRKLLSVTKVNKLIKLMKKKGLQNTFNEHVMTGEFKDEESKKILLLINKYIEIEKEEEFYDFLKEELKVLTQEKVLIKDEIEVDNITNFDFSKENHNIIIGCNNEDFLKLKKENNYFSDEAIKFLNFETSIEKNLKIMNEIEEILNFSNLQKSYFSFSTKIYSKEVQINDKLSKNKYEIKDTEEMLTNKRTSYSSDIYLIFKNNKFLKNNNKETEKNILKYSSKKEILVEINREQFKKKQSISATMLTSYFECEYKFYLQRILKIYPQKTNQLSLDIGSYIHYILEHTVNQEKIETYSSLEEKENLVIYEKKIVEDIKIISDYSKKEKLFFNTESSDKKNSIIERINMYSLDLIKVLIEQIKSEKFSILEVEKKLEYNKKGYTIVGKIDQILVDDNDNFIVVDYKSGKAKLELNIKDLENGIDMQNVIYFLLIKNNYNKAKSAGTYRVKVTPTLIEPKDKDKKTNLRNGHTKNNIDILNKINEENYVGLTRKKDNEFKKTKALIEEEDFDEFEQLVESKIDEFIQNMEMGTKVKINPLKTKNKDACEYCQYRNICYKSFKNYINK